MGPNTLQSGCFFGGAARSDVTSFISPERFFTLLLFSHGSPVEISLLYSRFILVIKRRIEEVGVVGAGEGGEMF